MRLEWIVPVVVVAVYIIGAIVKAREEQQAKAKQPTARNPGQELDKFLVEIEKLRREQAARAASVPQTMDELDEDDEEDEAPVVVRPPVRPAPVLPRREPTIVVRSVPRVAMPMPQPVSPPSPAATAPIVRPIAPMSAKAAPRDNAITIATALLRQPQSVRSAFVLNEIFGRPKCKLRPQ